MSKEAYITRVASFSAAHRLHNPRLPDSDNNRIYGKCNNPYGHGHNYRIEVTVRGVPDPLTGMVMDLKVLKNIIQTEIIEKVDHRNLNHDVDFLAGIIPTSENMAIKFWELLEPKITEGKLYEIKIHESENNSVSYRGE